MLHAERTLYWITPFFTLSDWPHFINHCSAENCKAFFCFDSQWNRVSMDDLKWLKNELKKHGRQLIFIEGPIEKVVPSVARVLKTERVIYALPENHHEYEAAIKKICRELELHSIAFCNHPSPHYSFYKGGDHPGIRHTI